MKGRTSGQRERSLVVSVQRRQDLVLYSLCLALIQIGNGKRSLHLPQSILQVDIWAL